MSIDNCTHSFGASKSYADLVVQEYGKNIGLKTACFRAGALLVLIILGLNFMVFYLTW